jgi:hypothetical protein
MGLDTARSFFLWCPVINYGVLLVWFGLVMAAREWLFRLWGRWFPIPREQFHTLNFAGMSLYKIGIILFNLVPCIALYLVR